MRRGKQTLGWNAESQTPSPLTSEDGLHVCVCVRACVCFYFGAHYTTIHAA